VSAAGPSPSGPSDSPRAAPRTEGAGGGIGELGARGAVEGQKITPRTRCRARSPATERPLRARPPPPSAHHPAAIYVPEKTHCKDLEGAKMAGALQPRRLSFSDDGSQQAGLRDFPTRALRSNEIHANLERFIENPPPGVAPPPGVHVENGYYIEVNPPQTAAFITASPWAGPEALRLHADNSGPLKLEFSNGIAGDQVYDFTYSLYGAPSSWPVPERTQNFVDSNPEVQRLLLHAMPLFEKYWPSGATVVKRAILKLLHQSHTDIG